MYEFRPFQLRAAHPPTERRLQGVIEEIRARPDDVDFAANASRALSRLFGENEGVPA